VVSLKKKSIKGHNYWYAVEMSRVHGKPKQTWQMYLGTVEKIVEAMKGSEGKPYAKIRSFEYGKIAAMLQINEELKFVDIVNKHTDKKSIEGLTVGEYLLLDIIGKSGGALSENSLDPWFNKSALSLLWKFPHKLTCQNFLNHMAYLDQNVIKNIETDISKTLIEKGIIPSVFYLDESNWFTYSDNYDNSSELLKKGHNKKHRNDKNQVNVALVANHENIPFIHETYPGNVHDSVEFPTLIDGIVNRLTDLKINTEDITLVFDKGNNSDKNIGKLTSKMSFVASAKSEQAEFLMDIPLTEFKNLYTNSKGHEIFGYRTKHIFFGTEFTTIVTYNKSTYNLQKESYGSRKAKIIEKLDDLKRRLESDRGKERNKTSVEREVADIILKDFRSIIKTTIIDTPKEKKKPQLSYEVNLENEKKREKGFGKLIIFTDKNEWHSKKIVQTYNNKYLVEDDFKLLNDELLVPIGPIYHTKDFNIRVHVFLAVMGLLFYRYMAWKTKKYNLSLKEIIDALSGIRIALVKDNKSDKSDIVLEEMSSNQGSLFSFLNLGKFIQEF
jgi:transposase